MSVNYSVSGVSAVPSFSHSHDVYREKTNRCMGGGERGTGCHVFFSDAPLFSSALEPLSLLLLCACVHLCDCEC